MYHTPRRSEPTGCVFLAILLWLVGLALTLAFWGLVAWGIWEGIQWLQRN